MLRHKHVYELIAREFHKNGLEIDFDEHGLCVYDITRQDHPLNFLEDINVVDIGSTINPELCDDSNDEFSAVYFGLWDNRYLLTFRTKINIDDGSVTGVEVADIADYENIIGKAIQCLTDEIKNYTINQLKKLYDDTAIMAGSVEDRKNALHEIKSKADSFFDELIEKVK